MIVVDANVAAKWYLNEPGSAEAAAILTSDSILLAPALIRIEVTGAFIRHYREGKLSRQRAGEACELWEADLAAGAVRLMPDDTLMEQARALAFDIRHAIQDCLYLAAAVSAGHVRLVTTDPAFHTRASSGFPFVEMLVPGKAQ